MYDLLIRNGEIVDGSGKESYVADIAVKDGKIAAIGQGLETAADQIITADGLVVAPGFVDCHSHSDLGLLGKHRFDNMLEQGITTEIVGNCGNTIAPVTYADLEKLAGLFGIKIQG